MTGQLGVIYMLHFDRPYRHAKHYVGWTADLLDRLARHGHGTGARLVEVISHAGIGFTLVRVCEGTGLPNAPSGRRCPLLPRVSPRPWNGHWAAMPADFTPRTYLNLAGRR